MNMAASTITALPPAAVAPGNTALGSKYNHCGFTFEQNGRRVPAVVISPWIPKNVVDHRLYDHASIPAAIEACFGITHLTSRDSQANHLVPLMSLQVARTDALTTLPTPAVSG